MPPRYQNQHLRSRLCFKLWLRRSKGSAFCHGMSTRRYICVSLIPYKSRKERRCIYQFADTEWRLWQFSSPFIRLGMMIRNNGVSDGLFLSMFLAYTALFGYPWLKQGLACLVWDAAAVNNRPNLSLPWTHWSARVCIEQLQSLEE